MDGTLPTALALIPAMIMAIVCHEVAHGWMALALGDPTAREQRRLSFNPLRHVDPVGTVALPALLALVGAPVFGWARPVPVDKWRLRNPRLGMMAVAAAGPATNLVLAAVGAVMLGLIGGPLDAPPLSAAGYANLALQFFVLINIFLALFNLLPIPPFDGSHIVEGVLPERAAQAYAGLRRYGLLLMIGLLVVVPAVFPHWNIVGRFVLPPVEWAQGHYFALARWIAGP